MNLELFKFYTANGLSGAGQTFEEIMALNDTELENQHDFIQWIFPTVTASQCVEGSPILDEETITALIGDETFRKRFHQAIAKMLTFWSIEYDEHTFKLQTIRGQRWWSDGNDHNKRRLARFIESCRLLRYRDVSLDLFERLLTFSTMPEGSDITTLNIFFWYRALNTI